MEMLRNGIIDQSSMDVHGTLGGHLGLNLYWHPSLYMLINVHYNLYMLIFETNTARSEHVPIVQIRVHVYKTVHYVCMTFICQLDFFEVRRTSSSLNFETKFILSGVKLYMQGFKFGTEEMPVTTQK